MKYIAVIIGGGLGSLLRFLISEWLVTEGNKWPWATFSTNILASLILGFFVGWFLKDSFHPWKLFWVVGFCGGFSTFSTYAKETLQLYQSGHIMTALSYVVLSSLIGVAMMFLGMKISDLTV